MRVLTIDLRARKRREARDIVDSLSLCSGIILQLEIRSEVRI
jgi:hypothetical protein